MGEYEFERISFQLPRSMKSGIEKIANEYNVTISEMMRILIVEVLPDQDCDSDEPMTRAYPRRSR